MTWTEIVTEHIAVVYVGGTEVEQRVMVPISDTSKISDEHIAVVKEKLEREVVLRRERQRFQEVVANINQRERAVERLEEAGCDRDEVPL